MNKEVFDYAKRIFSKYKGSVKSDDSGVVITARNRFDGKLIDCECGVVLLKSEKYPYSIYAEEKTFSIKGGIGQPCEGLDEIKENLEKTLQAFNFELNEQMSLFEF